jgi:hypothetical protein
MAAYSVTTQKKILGADYGLSVIFPIVNTRFTANLFNASAASAGVSDIYFAPIVLGWEKGNLNYTVNYGFYAPSGSFDPSSALNPGLGYWEHQIQAGATYSIGKPKLWNTFFLISGQVRIVGLRSVVAVGTTITDRPLHRSVRARLSDAASFEQQPSRA